jgi:hypothetical protein
LLGRWRAQFDREMKAYIDYATTGGKHWPHHTLVHAHDPTLVASALAQGWMPLHTPPATTPAMVCGCKVPSDACGGVSSLLSSSAVHMSSLYRCMHSAVT